MMDFTNQSTASLIGNYSSWVKETRPEALCTTLSQLLEECEFQVLNRVEHHFQPQGYTCLWLLAESHLAIHTFPEKGLCYVELTSCNAEKNRHFQKLLTENFTLSKEA